MAGWYISLELPLPPSKNRLYENALRWTKGKPGTDPKQYMARKKSPEYEAFEWEVAAAVGQQTTPEQLAQLQGKRLAMSILVRFPEDKRKHDTANVVDSLLDGLKVPLGVDDEHVWILDLRRHTVSDLPPCVVRIWDAEA